MTQIVHPSFLLNSSVLRQAKPPFPSEVAVNAVHFDGTNDNLLRGGALTGAVDGEEILVSLWFNITGNDGEFQLIFRDNITGILIIRRDTDKIGFRLKSDAPATIWDISSTASFTTLSNTGWHHLLVAAQLGVTPVAQIYLDDAALAHTEATAPANADINWAGPSDYAVGSVTDDTFRWDGDMAEVYITNEYLDISRLANRRKFISANGKPVEVGSDGSDPTGTAPLVFFSGDTDTWHTNKGSGGGFTETGALTTAATSPSD